MRGIACLTLMLVSLASAWNGPIVKVVHFGGTFAAHEPLPILDKGYLLYLNRPGSLTAYAPDGRRLFNTVVTDPQGGVMSIMSAAVDTDGTFAVTASLGSGQGYAGGIVFLDSAGRQMRFAETGRYMPAHVCFDRNHFLWTFGWQRGELDREDKQDYLQVRKFSKDAKEVGGHLPRSWFPGGLSPFKSSLGLWRVRAAKDRIGRAAAGNAGAPRLRDDDRAD